jgi:F-type H+-transporting ATPase subunit epsilon
MTEAAVENTFGFKLVSPERILMDEPAAQVVVPGEEGDLGVRKGHAPFVVSVRPGVVSIQKDIDGEIKQIFIAGGFADISAENCTILAEEAIDVSELNQADLEQKLTDLKEDLGLVSGAHDIQRVENELKIVNAKLTAVTGKLHI